MLRELEIKKPQLEELVQTAESLKTDANRQELHLKGEFSFILFYLNYCSRKLIDLFCVIKNKTKYEFILVEPMSMLMFDYGFSFAIPIPKRFRCKI